jgi:hypothetical protein
MASSAGEFDPLATMELYDDHVPTQPANRISKSHFAGATLAVLVLCCGCFFVGSNFREKEMSKVSDAGLVLELMHRMGTYRHKTYVDGVMSLVQLEKPPRELSACSEAFWKKTIPMVLTDMFSFMLCKMDVTDGGEPGDLCAFVKKIAGEIVTEGTTCGAGEKTCEIDGSSPAAGEEKEKLCVPTACEEDLKGDVKKLEGFIFKDVPKTVPEEDRPKIALTCK